MPAAAVDVVLASATRERVVDRRARHRALLPAVEHVLDACDAIAVAERRIAGQARRQVDRHGPIGLVGDRVESFAAVETVRARPTGQHVVAAAPGDRVVARPAVERLACRTSAEHVRPVLAEHRHGKRAAVRDAVVPVPGADLDRRDARRRTRDRRRARAPRRSPRRPPALWHRCRRRRAPIPEAPTVMAFASPGAASNRTVDDPAACVTVAATDRAGIASATAAAVMHGAAIRRAPCPSISVVFGSPQGGKSIVPLGSLPPSGNTMLLPLAYRHTSIWHRAERLARRCWSIGPSTRRHSGVARGRRDARGRCARSSSSGCSSRSSSSRCLRHSR